MRQLVESRRFALADLGLICLSGAIWFFWPGIGGWPVIIALIPWIVRIGARQFPITITGFEVPLVIFLISGVIGVWVAYNRELAWEKYWILFSAVLLFYALSRQPKSNILIMPGIVTLIAVLISIFFLLSNDWISQPSDLTIINQLGRLWMGVRPKLIASELSANFTGGLLAIFLPFAIAAIWMSKAQHRLDWLIVYILGVVIILIGLFLSSSRGAWLAIVAGGGGWLIWQVSNWIAKRFQKPVLIIFGLALFFCGVILVGFINFFPGGVVALADRLPGLPTGGSRLDLAQSASKLISDFPFTGGGLRSFPGLYSQYILVIPNYKFGYSHNFYTDLFLELGVFGGLAWLVVTLGGVWLLLRLLTNKDTPLGYRYIMGAVGVAYIVMFVHGIVDDAIFGEQGTIFLFFLPGLSVGLMRSSQILEMDENHESSRDGKKKKPSLQLCMGLGVLVFVMIVIGLAIGNSAVRSRWYANLGDVTMARKDLAEWPFKEWNSNIDVSGYESAERDYVRSVELHPDQRTAWHRMGLISLQSRNFNQAIAELENALIYDPRHRGIRKNLGYAYTWVGADDKAILLLNDISEAAGEMETYSRWWRGQQRPDLATRAKVMASELKKLKSSPSGE
jgi:O-antigen ligase